MSTEKRLLLALALSFLVVVTWTRFFNRPSLPQNPQDYPQQAIKQPSALPLPEKTINSQVNPTDFTFKDHQVDLIFVEPWGAIRQAVFQKYQDYKFALNRGILVGYPDMEFYRQLFDNKGVIYNFQDQEKLITKELYVADAEYAFDLVLKIKNTSSSLISVQLPVTLGQIDMTASKDRMNFHDVTVSDQEKTFYPNPKKTATFGGVNFIAMRDRYFCAIIQPLQKGSAGFINKVSTNGYDVGLLLPEAKIEPGQVWEQKFKVYIGPQDTKILKKADPAWQAVVYFGKFDLIAQVLLAFIDFLYRIVNNWGWAIVILSFCIYLLVYPLTLKQMKSMKEMQVLQPQVEELRVLHKNNPQRLNKEIMELYKAHKVNPLGGCLPMVLQIPVFFALYQVLSRTVALKGADFLWIKDLSEPDKLFTLPNSLPVIGNEINILPILMAIGMFFQQKTSMVSISQNQAEQQKIMMIVMPIMFGVLFYHMPSGLVLYWFINSSLTLAYQLRVSRKK